MIQTQSPYQVRWGVVGLGGIAQRFLTDLVLDPAGRDVADVSHKIAAVGSRSLDKAQAFIKDNKLDASGAAVEGGITAYGSYEELYADETVDVVYVASPHPQHYANVKAALQAGRNVLCEKPFVLTAGQATELVELARTKGVFFMEAVWTRFQPVVAAAQKVVFGGEIGAIKRVDSRFDKDFGDLPHEHRMLNPALAGGALFDLGPYALLWSTLFLYQHPQNEGADPEDIKASIRWDKRTGIDASTTAVLTYPRLGAQATVSVSLDTPTAPNSIVVTGSKGSLTLHGPSPYPSSFTVLLFDKPDDAKTFEYPIKQGRGMHWQADAVARALRDGKTEEPRMSWRETVLQQEVFDAIVSSGGLTAEIAKLV